MADVPNATDVSTLQWALGLVASAWVAFLTILHRQQAARQDTETHAREAAQRAIAEDVGKLWAAVDEVKRDFREVATKQDLRDAEQRLSELIRNRPRGGHAD